MKATHEYPIPGDLGRYSMVKTGVRTCERPWPAKQCLPQVPGRALDIPQRCDDASAVAHEAGRQLAWDLTPIRRGTTRGKLHGLLRGLRRRGQS